MARHILAFLTILLLFSGCRATGRAVDPTDMARRLAVLERSRTLPSQSMESMWAVGSDLASRKRPAQRLTQAAYDGNSRESWREGMALVTLGEFQDETEPAGDEEAELAFDAAEMEELYARRPPLRSFWETVQRDIKYLPKDLWRDTKRVYANPVNLVILGGAYGGSLALQQSGVDDSIQDHFNHRNDLRPAHHHFNEDWRDAFGAIGNPGTHFALAGAWYLLGQQTMDDKTYEVGKTLFSALMINGVTVMVGQAATYDRAPNGELGTFPSGHTSSSFVFASVMHEAYGHVVGAPLYALATLVAYERVEDGEHYFSDVVMGGVLGLVVGHSVASGRDPEFFGWKLMPYASPNGGAGLAFVKTLE